MNSYERIAKAIRYLDEHAAEQPGLAELADAVGLSEFHFHRVFSQWAGVTPKSFLQCLTLGHAKRSLLEGRSVLDASLDAGLSGPGRLHDLCVTLQAASPGEVKARGAGMTIRAGVAESPLGSCLVAESERGVCHVSFVDSIDRGSCEAAIRDDWPLAAIAWGDGGAARVAERIFRPSRRKPSSSRTQTSGETLRCHVRGTAFQLRVWKALLAVPFGHVVSYGRLAESLGEPGAARAVGSAVACNRIAALIPCHRVIRETGIVGDYRWGRERKRALLAFEASRSERPDEST